MNNLSLSAPRQLNPDEADALSALLRSHLKLNNCSCVFQAEEDATDLLAYALDMIDEGEPIGNILGELAFMELEICNDDVLDKMRDSLAVYFVGLMDGAKKKNWREERAAREAAFPKVEAVAPVPKSCESKKNWREEREERAAREAAFPKDEAVAPEPKSYEIKKNWREERVVNEAESSQPESFEVQLLSSEKHEGNVDLSAAAAAMKHAKEVESLFGGDKRGSLKERMAMYNENGEIVKQQQRDERDDNINRTSGPSIDDIRRRELMAVMNDRSLSKSERALKIEEVKAKYGAAEPKQPVRHEANLTQGEVSSDHRDDQHMGGNGSSYSSSTSPRGVDLSAKAASEKHAREVASLFGGGKAGRLKDRMAMYDDNGQIIKRNAQDGGVGSNQATKEKSLHQQRRDELMEAMKDKSLSKDERAQRMDEIRQKYGGGTTAEVAAVKPTYCHSSRLEPIASGSEGGSSTASTVKAPPPGGVDLSAKAASEKNAREMAALFGGGIGKTMNNNRLRYQQQLRRDSAEVKAGKRTISEDIAPEKSGDVKIEPISSTQPSLDTLRRDELQSIMRDTSLNKMERREKIDEVKAKYAAMAIEQSQSTSIARGIGNAGQSSPGVVDLSAKAASQKHAQEIANLFGGGGAKATMSSNRENYERQLRLDCPRQKLGKCGVLDTTHEDSDVQNDLTVEQSTEIQSLGAQRRAELQSIMRDRSLTKDERRRQMDAIKEIYAELARAQEFGGMSGARYDRYGTSDSLASSLTWSHTGKYNLCTHAIETSNRVPYTVFVISGEEGVA